MTDLPVDSFGYLDHARIQAHLNDVIAEITTEAIRAQAVSTETALRRAVAEIREMHRDQKTVVVSSATPVDLDYFFPATVVRSPLVEPGVAYILPSEAELDDVMRRGGWDGEGPVVL